MAASPARKQPPANKPSPKQVTGSPRQTKVPDKEVSDILGGKHDQFK